MSTIPQVAQAMQEVLTTQAEAAGEAVGFIKRPDKAKFSASTFTQTLVFGWLAHPDATLEQLAAMGVRVGVDISAQALHQRFTSTSAALLREVLAASVTEVVASDPVAIPILQRFSGVVVHDGTTITLPDALAEQWSGCGGSTSEGTSAALKCGVQLDLLTGQLRAIDLVNGRTHDNALPCQSAPLPPGALRLADLGFFDLDVLADLDATGVYWLSKVRATTVVTPATGVREELVRFVQHTAAAGWDEWVMIGAGGRLRARLIVEPVPQEVADQRRRRIRKEARDKGREPSAAALTLAAWTIVITNVPHALLSGAEAIVVMRVRWQIELLFKLWKSHGGIDRWRSANPQRILCEVYAKLVAMVVQHWALVVGSWNYADRSLMKASQMVRDYAGEFASARLRLDALCQALNGLCQVLRRTARINPRRKHPNTFQLLLALTTLHEQA